MGNCAASDVENRRQSNEGLKGSSQSNNELEQVEKLMENICAGNFSAAKASLNKPNLNLNLQRRKDGNNVLHCLMISSCLYTEQENKELMDLILNYQKDKQNNDRVNRQKLGKTQNVEQEKPNPNHFIQYKFLPHSISEKNIQELENLKSDKEFKRNIINHYLPERVNWWI